MSNDVPSTDIQIVQDAVFLETVHFLSDDEDFTSLVLNRPLIEIARNTGWLKTQLDALEAAKEPTIAKNNAFNKAFGTTTGTVTEGNDPRLSDTRVAKPHTHTFSEITPPSSTVGYLFFNGSTFENKPRTELETTVVNWNSIVNTPAYFASSIDLVFGLTTALFGKAAKLHTHTMSDITGLSAAITSINTAITGKAPAAHTHTFDSLTSKPSTIAGYGIVDAYTKAQVDSKLTGVLPGVGSKPAVSVRTPRVMIPFYVYPSNIYTNPDYNRLIQAARDFPGVEFTVILNNSNGVGAARDLNFVAAITRLKATSNVKILGYITTSNGAVTAAAAKAEIDTWVTWYSPDGIFIDEMSNLANPALVAYYADLTNYIHSKGMPLSVGNPGTAQLPMYFAGNAADIICVFENTYVPDEPFLKGDFAGGYADYPTSGRAALMYAQPNFNRNTAKLLSRHTGMWFITDETAPVLWSKLPVYFEEMLKWMQSYGYAPEEPVPVIQRVVATPSADGEFILSIPSGTVFKVSLNGVDIDGEWTFSNQNLTVQGLSTTDTVVVYYCSVGTDFYKGVITASGTDIIVPANVAVWQITANGIDLDTYIQSGSSITIPGASSGDLLIVYGNVT